MGLAIPFSEKELHEIERMLKENIPIKRIANTLGRTENGVRNKIRDYGGVLNFSAQKAIESCKKTKNSSFTPKQKNMILQLYSENKSIDYLRKRLRSTRKEIRSFLSEHGLSFPATAPIPVNQNILDRIDALEMQIQILTQVIRHHVKNTDYA